MIRNQYNRIPHPALDIKCDTKFVLQKMLLRKECFTKTTLRLLQLNPTYRLQKRILICQQ